MSVRAYSLRHLADSTLRQAPKQLVLTDCTTTALIVAHVAEFIARRLYLEDGYASMYDYCVGQLKRFPQPDLPTFIESLGTAGAAPAPQVAQGQSAGIAGTVMEVCTLPSHSSAPARIDDPVISVVTPLAPERFGWQLTVDQEAQDLLGDVTDLLGHEVPPGDMAAVLKYARDGGRCTFTSDIGHRCEERKDLEFDHIDPYARGGEATVSGIRLLCRAHNQFEAEHTYGAEFMRRKREGARRVQT